MNNPSSDSLCEPRLQHKAEEVHDDIWLDEFSKKGICKISLHLTCSSTPWLEYENSVHGVPMDRGIVYLTEKDVIDLLTLLGYDATGPGESSLG
jgi:hypothetical protein